MKIRDMNKSRIQYAKGYIEEKRKTRFGTPATYALIILEADRVWRQWHKEGFLLGKGTHKEYCDYLNGACKTEWFNAQWRKHLTREECDCLDLAYGKLAGLVESLNFNSFVGAVKFLEEKFNGDITDDETLEILETAAASHQTREGIPIFCIFSAPRPGTEYLFREAMGILRKNPGCSSWACEPNIVELGRIEWAMKMKLDKKSGAGKILNAQSIGDAAAGLAAAIEKANYNYSRDGLYGSTGNCNLQGLSEGELEDFYEAFVADICCMVGWRARAFVMREDIMEGFSMTVRDAWERLLDRMKGEVNHA